MIRDIYVEQSPEDAAKARAVEREARENRRKRNRENAKRYYTPRDEMTPEELEEARRKGRERSQRYNRNQRIRKGLPPVGRPGRPRKKAV